QVAKQTAGKNAQSGKTASKKGSSKNSVTAKATGKSSGKGQRILAEAVPARRGKFGKPVREEVVADNASSNKSSRNGRSARPRASVNDKQVQALLHKRGRLTKAERRTLASYGSSRRARARALQLARLRAVRAHDEALHNITAANIEKDNSTGED